MVGVERTTGCMYSALNNKNHTETIRSQGKSSARVMPGLEKSGKGHAGAGEIRGRGMPEHGEIRRNYDRG